MAVTVFAMMFGTATLFAQSKYDIRTAKKTAKELQKQGWKLDGGVKTVEAYLVSYYELEKENELSEGRATIPNRNIKVATNMARRNAVQNYIELSSTEMKGAFSGLDGVLEAQVIDNMTTAMVGKFKGKIEGELSVDFCLFRTEKDGQFSCICYCHIDKKKSEQLKKEAFQEAVAEAEGVKKFSTKVMDIINEVQF